MRRETIPPQALLIRRMEGLVLAVLGELRAGADWAALGARVLRRRAALDAARGAGRRLLGGRRGGARAPRRLRGVTRRTLLLALARCSPCSPPAAGGATRTIDLPALFATQIERAHARRPTVPILLPQTMRSDFRRHFAEGRAPRRTRWRFDIGAVRDCNQATVCFVAEFKAVRDGRPSGRRTDPPQPRAHRLLPPALAAAPPARRPASSGASATRSTRSRRRSPSASSCGWPTRPSATARAEPRPGRRDPPAPVGSRRPTVRRRVDAVPLPWPCRPDRDRARARSPRRRPPPPTAPGSTRSTASATCSTARRSPRAAPRSWRSTTATSWRA